VEPKPVLYVYRGYCMQIADEFLNNPQTNNKRLLTFVDDLISNGFYMLIYTKKSSHLLLCIIIIFIVVLHLLLFPCFVPRRTKCNFSCSSSNSLNPCIDISFHSIIVASLNCIILFGYETERNISLSLDTKRNTS